VLYAIALPSLPVATCYLHAESPWPYRHAVTQSYDYPAPESFADHNRKFWLYLAGFIARRETVARYQVTDTAAATQCAVQSRRERRKSAAAGTRSLRRAVRELLA
jgi:hypothetical protein